MYDKAPAFGGNPFTGLLYELDAEGNLRYYQYYKDGFGDGEYVTFYDNGAVASYCIMKGFSFVGKLYKWYRNGRLKCFYEKGSNRRYIRTIKYDKGGNIILQIEDGVTIVEPK